MVTTPRENYWWRILSPIQVRGRPKRRKSTRKYVSPDPLTIFNSWLLEARHHFSHGKRLAWKLEKRFYQLLPFFFSGRLDQKRAGENLECLQCCRCCCHCCCRCCCSLGLPYIHSKHDGCSSNTIREYQKRTTTTNRFLSITQHRRTLR